MVHLYQPSLSVLYHAAPHAAYPCDYYYYCYFRFEFVFHILLQVRPGLPKASQSKNLWELLVWKLSSVRMPFQARPAQSSNNDSVVVVVVVFLACDAMRKCGFCCRPVSVRLSRWCIVSRRLKISTNSFLGPVAPSFQFFWLLVLIPNSKGNPISGVQNTWGWEILRPSTEITIYLGNSTI